MIPSKFFFVLILPAPHHISWTRMMKEGVDRRYPNCFSSFLGAFGNRDRIYCIQSEIQCISRCGVEVSHLRTLPTWFWAFTFISSLPVRLFGLSQGLHVLLRFKFSSRLASLLPSLASFLSSFLPFLVPIVLGQLSLASGRLCLDVCIPTVLSASLHFWYLPWHGDFHIWFLVAVLVLDD